MIGKTLIFKIKPDPSDLGDIVLYGTEVKILMPPTEEQLKKPIKGSCGHILKLEDYQ